MRDRRGSEKKGTRVGLLFSFFVVVISPTKEKDFLEIFAPPPLRVCVFVACPYFLTHTHTHTHTG